MGVTKAARASADFLIDHLKLSPHPEGGYFRQTYCDQTAIAQSALPSGFKGSRSASTAIYFLLRDDDFSAFHRIPSDELWHFYVGDPIEIIVLKHDGAVESIVLGPELADGQTFQAVVTGGQWFASRLLKGGDFALVGCTVAPGFHFDDFELAHRKDLLRSFPQHRALIEQLTHD